ncbi:hypothetical protein ACFOZ7_20440 [Natribaculum luteum]|uniref:Uncharacterized protein n=1 Tax=Natribaculum luteum TaxID=1586232 RepID=A0ABD5P552_9EURY|nr:hypothetical protein [Natribaculum luteum]
MGCADDHEGGDGADGDVTARPTWRDAVSRDPTRLSRRRLLAGVGLGAFGVAGGAGTGAYLSDLESFTGTQQAGRVGIDVRCDSDACSETDGRIAFAFDGLRPGDAGVERFRLAVHDDGNPVRVWLRTDCPPIADPLGSVLEVQLVVDDCRSGGSTTFPASGWGTLDGLRRALADGLRLDGPDQPCLSTGEERCLVFRYRLPSDATWTTAAESGLELEFYAEQCRHVSEADVGDGPFADVRCPELDCPPADCVELGTIDVEGGRLEAGETYLITDEYQLQVLSVTDKRDDGERETVCASFRLLKDGEERNAPPICAVAIGGGIPRGTPPAGDEPGGSDGGDHPSDPESRIVEYAIEPPSTRTRGELCAAHGDRDDPDERADHERPGISNVTVSVCADGDESDDDDESDLDCVPCADGSDHRAVEATFEYAGPADDATIVVTQAGRNGSTISVFGIDAGESFTLELADSGRPDFDVTVVTADGTRSIGDFHTSCSEPFGPGTVVTDGTYSLTVLEAFDRRRNPLCEVTGR